MQCKVCYPMLLDCIGLIKNQKRWNSIYWEGDAFILLFSFFNFFKIYFNQKSEKWNSIYWEGYAFMAWHNIMYSGQTSLSAILKSAILRIPQKCKKSHFQLSILNGLLKIWLTQLQSNWLMCSTYKTAI